MRERVLQQGGRLLRWAVGSVSGGAIWLVLLVLGMAYFRVLDRYVERFGGDLSGLICMGEYFMPPEEAPDGLFLFRNTVGYDGQFFYFMARDPLALGDMYAYVDVPAYRYQRILYPVLVAAASLGRSAKIPAMLVWVNFAALLLGTGCAGLLLRRRGLSPWYALFYGLLSGLLLAFLRDLAGGVAMALMLGALYLYEGKRFGWAGVLMGGALLARETTAVLIPVLIVDALVFKRDRRALRASIPPLVPFALWLTYVGLRFGTPPWSGGQRNLGVPFVAVSRHAWRVFSTAGVTVEECLYLALFLVSAVMAVALAVREFARRRDEISLAFLGFSLQPWVMTHHVWVEPWSYGRVLLPSAVFLFLSFVRSGDKWHLVPLALHTAMWVVILFWQDIIIL